MTTPYYMLLPLMILALLSFSVIGRFLGEKKIFTSMVLGLCCTGLIVAILANFAAGLIRPTIILLIILGLIHFLTNIKKNTSPKQKLMYALLLFLGAILLALNDPVSTFVRNSLLIYNPHYSYYSSQSTEMLNSHYLGRLRLSEFWPNEWSRYHFFNSSVQASVSGLIPHPNLFSYFTAQILIAALIILSIIENIFFVFKFTLKTVLITGSWLLIGFSIFSHAVTWNFYTTGPLSIFALALIMLNTYQKNNRAVFLYTIIFGLSALRLLPIALAIIALIYVINFKTITAKKFAEKHLKTVKILIINWYYGIFTLLAIIYNAITLFSSKDPQFYDRGTFITKSFNYQGWDFVLISYKLAGLFNNWRGGITLFKTFNDEGYLSGPLHNTNLFYLLILFLLGCLYLVVKSIIKFLLRKKSLIPDVLAMIIVIIPLIILLPLWPKIFVVLVAPYAICSILLIMDLKLCSQDRNQLMLLWAVIYGVGIIFQFCGVDLSIKAPILYLVCDVLTWLIIGIYLFNKVDDQKVLSSAIFISLCLITIFGFRISKMMVIPVPYSVVDIKPLETSRREDYLVEGTNICNFDYKLWNKNGAFASIVGCDLPYSDKNWQLMSSRFLTEKINAGENDD